MISFADAFKPSTFPPFHRSLTATLTLRFPQPGISGIRGNPYRPESEQIPSIRAYISLYPLNPKPPAQPGALPALPTLLSQSGSRRPPNLVTVYPSGSIVNTPDSFASQLLSRNHALLQRNLAVSTRANMIDIWLGHVRIPSVERLSLSSMTTDAYLPPFYQRIKEAQSLRSRVLVLKDYFTTGLHLIWNTMMNGLRLGVATQDYRHFEGGILRAIKARRARTDLVGQYSWLSMMLYIIHPRRLERILNYLPTMPAPTGPSGPHPILPVDQKFIPISEMSAASSSSESDHEGSDDLISSRHTVTSDESGSAASGTGLDASWVGVEVGN